MFGFGIVQPDGVDDFLHDFDFLARAIDEGELHIGVENSEGDARQSATGSQVQDFGARPELHYLRYRQRVQDMVWVQLVDVLTGNDVDLIVPLPVQGAELFKLSDLLLRQLGKVLK